MVTHRVCVVLPGCGVKKNNSGSDFALAQLFIIKEMPSNNNLLPGSRAFPSATEVAYVSVDG